MKRVRWLALAGGVAAVLVACGGGGSDPGGSTVVDQSGARGSLVYNPPLRVTALTAQQLTDRLKATSSGTSLLALAGAPACGVSINYIEYGTVGGAGETTNASGALMVPSGSGANCSGPRPIVLYAHGTTTDRAYNIADITESSRPGATEGSLLAAMFAAQGFIVVAPNYAGYDVSKLNYHPYLNADQQSKDMIDALTAARKALPNVGGQDSGKLLLTGYSQGGHVAVATLKALQAAGQKVVATAGMSGPYALSSFGDAIFTGHVDLGATVFTPLLSTSYQKAYGNIYRQTTDIYEAPYAAGIETLLPSTTPIATLFTQGKLPQTALFSSTAPAPGLESVTPPVTNTPLDALFALGFGSNNLVANTRRLAFLQDAQAHPSSDAAPATSPADTLRQAFVTNDLRNFLPQSPVMLCGGNGDPTVFFNNSAQIQGYWAGKSVPAPLVTMLDVDSTPSGPADPFAAVKVGFTQTKAGLAAQAGGGDAGANAVVQAYHGTLVPPFCTAAARGFFQQVLSGPN